MGGFLYAFFALLKAIGLEDLAMWLLSAIASIIGAVAVAYVLALIARWLFARSAHELISLFLLFVAGAFSSFEFGFIPTAKWVALAIAVTVAAIVCILIVGGALLSSTKWLSAVGAAAAVVLCAFVAQLFLSWLHVRNELVLITGAITTASMSGLIISATQRRHMLAVLLAAIICAVWLPHIGPPTAFALALRSWLAGGGVVAGLSAGLLFGLSRKSTSLVN